MTVCYFGTYSKAEGYNRNRVIIKGLRQNGVEVKECHADLWKSRADKIKGIKSLHYNLKLILHFIFTYISLIVKFFRIGKYDILIVGYAGHLDVFLAKILNLFRKRPLIFDVFLSLYDAAVNEYKAVKTGSLKADLLRLIDRYSCCFADCVLLDTNEHIKYFSEQFRLPREKFLRIFIGQDDEIFKPVKRYENDNSPIEVLFFGTYIPLHGIEHIIGAAKELEKVNNIHFTLVSKGHLYEQMHNLASRFNLGNISFVGHWVNYSELIKYISRADICLGIFGTTEKAKRVIPSKVYDCLAMAKPVITGDSPAAKEVFIHREHILLCQMGDAFAIASAILELKNNPELKSRIAENGYELFKAKFTPRQLGKSVREGIELLL